MEDRVRSLLAQLRAVEEELRTALREQESRLHFQVVGKRIEFQEAIRRRHRELRMGLWRWMGQSEWRNVLSAPLIYAMIVPFVCLDIGLTLYQTLCFPLYRIPKVRRGDYVVMDRHHLGYLNAIERLNCIYCGYANGLIAYSREIAARTEQYWCPIKHARRILGTHSRYVRFLDYGDATDYQARLAELRAELSAEE